MSNVPWRRKKNQDKRTEQTSWRRRAKHCEAATQASPTEEDQTICQCRGTGQRERIEAHYCKEVAKVKLQP